MFTPVLMTLLLELVLVAYALIRHPQKLRSIALAIADLANRPQSRKRSTRRRRVAGDPLPMGIGRNKRKQQNSDWRPLVAPSDRLESDLIQALVGCGAKESQARLIVRETLDQDPALDFSGAFAIVSRRCSQAGGVR
jgi:hypothetical protein